MDAGRSFGEKPGCVNSSRAIDKRSAGKFLFSLEEIGNLRALLASSTVVWGNIATSDGASATATEQDEHHLVLVMV